MGDGRLVRCEASFFSSVLCKRCPSFPHPSICLVWVIAAAAVGAVAAFSHVQEGVLTRVHLGNPLPRNQEGGQVKQIHKHLVAITGKTYIRLINTPCSSFWEDGLHIAANSHLISQHCFTWIIPTDAECFIWRLDLSQIIWPTWQWSAGTDSLMSHLCRLYCQSFCAPYTHGCLGDNSGINYARSKIKSLLICKIKSFVLFYSVLTLLIGFAPQGVLGQVYLQFWCFMFSVVSHTSPFCHEGVDVHQRCQELERNLKSRLLPESRWR